MPFTTPEVDPTQFNSSTGMENIPETTVDGNVRNPDGPVMRKNGEESLHEDMIEESLSRDVPEENASNEVPFESDKESVSSDSSVEQCDSDIKDTTNDSCGLSSVSTWTYENLSTLLFLSGPGKLTEKQYKNVRRKLNACQKENGKPLFPSVSTFYRVLQPLALKSLFVQSRLVPVSIAPKKPEGGLDASRYVNGGKEEVRIVLPSEWAKRDFLCPVTHDLIWGEESRAGLNDNLTEFIDSCPIVRDRRKNLSLFRLSSREGDEEYIRRGSQVEISCIRSSEVTHALNSLGIIEEPDCNVTLPLLSATFIVQRICMIDHENDPVKEIKGASRDGDVEIHIETREGSAFLHLRGLKSSNDEIRQGLTIIHPSIPSSPRTFHVENVFSKPNTSPCKSIPDSKGNLSDGRKFYIYRFLLYNDGFSALRKRSSMDGCYIVPLGIPPSKRTIEGSIRRLWLTPPGVSSRPLSELIVDDIMKSAKEGIVVRVDDEDHVIVLDLVLYLGDWPALREMLDVMGHNALIPCHLCLFRRGVRTDYGGTYFAYDAFQSSGNMCIRRTGDRMMTMRRTLCDREDLQQLGLRLVQKSTKYDSPFHRLSVELKESFSSLLKDKRGKPIVSPFFDPYRSCVISADHMFHGLSVNLMNSCLSILDSTERKKLEYLLISYVSHYGMGYIPVVLDGDKKDLRTLTISETNTIRVLFPECLASVMSMEESLSTEERFIRTQLRRMSFDFDALVSSTIFQPSLDVDGRQSVYSYSQDGGKKRLQSLRTKAIKYLESVHHLCSTRPKLRKILDKPNLHRLLEFYQHTLPMFRNVSFILELVLERAHKDLKTSVNKSNQKKSHIQAMETVLSNDWVCRVAHELVRQPENEKHPYISLLRYLGKETSDSSVSAEEISYIRNTFKPDLLHDFKSKAHSLCRNSCSQWIPKQKKPMCDIPSEQIRKSIEGMMVSLEEMVFQEYTSIFTPLKKEYITMELFLFLDRNELKGMNSSWQRIYRATEGSIIQMLTISSTAQNDNEFMYVEYSSEGEMTLFVCHYFLEVSVDLQTSKDKRVYCIATPLKPYESESAAGKLATTHIKYWEASFPSMTTIFRIHETCRKCIALNARWLENNLSAPTSVEMHPQTPSVGGIFVVKGRSQGYPSRQG